MLHLQALEDIDLLDVHQVRIQCSLYLLDLEVREIIVLLVNLSALLLGGLGEGVTDSQVEDTEHGSEVAHQEELLVTNKGEREIKQYGELCTHVSNSSCVGGVMVNCPPVVIPPYPMNRLSRVLLTDRMMISLLTAMTPARPANGYQPPYFATISENELAGAATTAAGAAGVAAGFSSAETGREVVKERMADKRWELTHAEKERGREKEVWLRWM